MRLWNRKRLTALCLVFVLLAVFLPVRLGGAQAEVMPERISESEWKKLPTGTGGAVGADQYFCERQRKQMDEKS